MSKVSQYKKDNSVITGRGFVRCLSVSFSRATERLIRNTRSTYKVGEWDGTYRVVTDLLRYCCYKCVHENVSIRFKGGRMEFAPYHPYKQILIKNFQRRSYRGFDFTYKDIKPGGIKIAKTVTPEFSRELGYKKTETELRVNGELNEQMSAIINKSSTYGDNKTKVYIKQIVEEIHWYFPMHSSFELEQILLETFTLIIRCGVNEYPIDLTWSRRTPPGVKGNKVFMMRSPHTQEEKADFLPKRAEVIAMWRYQASVRTKWKLKTDKYIRHYKKESKRHALVDFDLIDEWNELYSEDLIEPFNKTTEELIRLYTTKEKQSLGHLIQQNTTQDLRHYLLDLL